MITKVLNTPHSKKRALCPLSVVTMKATHPQYRQLQKTIDCHVYAVLLKLAEYFLKAKNLIYK
jgi:hypothetical protein